MLSWIMYRQIELANVQIRNVQIRNAQIRNVQIRKEEIHENNKNTKWKQFNTGFRRTA